jgi:hypothetical protein
VKLCFTIKKVVLQLYRYETYNNCCYNSSSRVVGM